MHIAIVSVGTIGHVLPTLPFVTELIRRGVRVTYFTIEATESKVAFTGAKVVTFDSLLTKPAAQKKILDDIIAELPLRFLSEADHVVEQILPIMKEDRPDIILFDALAIAGRLAAHALDLKAVQICTTYASNSKFSICRTWPHVPDAHPARAAANELAKKLTAKYGVKHLDLYEIFEGSEKLNIILLQKAFHPASDAFDERYIFAGAQIAPRDNSGTWKAPEDGRPLIFSSLGTMFNNWPEFYGMLFEAVKDLPVNVAASIGTIIKPESLGPIPENVKLAPYLPQLDILEKADLFITHAGTGSVMEAIWYGVPMIGIPQMPEQVMTAQRFAELGLGAAFPDKGKITAKGLRAAIQELLENRSYREKAAVLQKDIKKAGGYELAADAIMAFCEGKPVNKHAEVVADTSQSR